MQEEYVFRDTRQTRPNFVTHRDEGGGQLNTLRTLQNEGARSLSKLVRFPAPDHRPG